MNKFTQHNLFSKTKKQPQKETAFLSVFYAF